MKKSLLGIKLKGSSLRRYGGKQEVRKHSKVVAFKGKTLYWLSNKQLFIKSRLAYESPALKYTVCFIFKYNCTACHYRHTDTDILNSMPSIFINFGRNSLALTIAQTGNTYIHGHLHMNSHSCTVGEGWWRQNLFSCNSFATTNQSRDIPQSCTLQFISENTNI